MAFVIYVGFGSMVMYLLYEGFTTGKIIGRDFGGKPLRYYTKEDDTFRYWTLIVSYSVMALFIGSLLFKTLKF